MTPDIINDSTPTPTQALRHEPITDARTETNSTPAETPDFHTSTPANQPNPQQPTAGQFRDFVAIKLHEAAPKSITFYAAKLYLSTLEENPDALPSPLPLQLRLILARTSLNGMAPATLRRYLRKLHSLWQEWQAPQDSPEADPFEEITPLLPSLKDYSAQAAEADRSLSLLRANIGRIHARSESDPAAKALLHILSNADFNLRRLVNLTIEEARQINPEANPDYARESTTLIPDDSCATQYHRRKYYLPLTQNRKRDPQLMRELSQGIRRLLTGIGLTVTDPKTLWIAAALRAGLSYLQIRAIVGKIPLTYSPLELIDSSIVSSIDSSTDTLIGGDPEKQSTINYQPSTARVARVFYTVGPQWYAIRLRAHTKAADIQEIITTEIPQYAPGIEYYYPTIRRATRKGDKLRFTDDPILPGLLFIRAEPLLLDRIADLIIEKGWIYRTSRRPDADYSAIPLGDMLLLRHAVTLLPEMQIELIRATPLRRGQKVRILQGPFAGHEAEILKIDGGADTETDTKTEDKKTYQTVQIALTTTTAIRWQMTIESPFLLPLP